MRARSIIYEPTHCSAHGRAPDGAAAVSLNRGGQPSASPADPACGCCIATLSGVVKPPSRAADS
jgi:hypothetical protein